MRRNCRQHRHYRLLGHFRQPGDFQLLGHFRFFGHNRLLGHFGPRHGSLGERSGRNLRLLGGLHGHGDIERGENVGSLARELIGELDDHLAVAVLETGLGGGVLHLILPLLLEHDDHLLHDPLEHRLDDLLRGLLGLVQRAEHALELLVARRFHLHLQSCLVQLQEVRVDPRFQHGFEMELDLIGAVVGQEGRLDFELLLVIVQQAVHQLREIYPEIVQNVAEGRVVVLVHGVVDVAVGERAQKEFGGRRLKVFLDVGQYRAVH